MKGGNHSISNLIHLIFSANSQAFEVRCYLRDELACLRPFKFTSWDDLGSVIFYSRSKGTFREPKTQDSHHHCHTSTVEPGSLFHRYHAYL